MAKTIDQLSADVDSLSKKLAVIEDILTKLVTLESSIKSNDSRISKLETKFSELERTDEASGWKTWKEQNPE